MSFFSDQALLRELVVAFAFEFSNFVVSCD